MDDQDAKADIQIKVVLLRPVDTGRGLVPIRKSPETPWQMGSAIIPSAFPKGT